MTKRLSILATLIALCTLTVAAQVVVRDTVEIHFRKGGGSIVLKHCQNGSAIEALRTHDRSDNSQFRYFLKRADIYGTASPEGSIAINNHLSKQRANSLAQQVSKYLSIPDSLIVRHCVGRDWRRLRVLASLDDKVPSQEAVVNLLDIIAAEAESGKPHKEDPLYRLRSIDNGSAYAYLARHHFPKLRAARLLLTYNSIAKLQEISSAAKGRTKFSTTPLTAARPAFVSSCTIADSKSSSIAANADTTLQHSVNSGEALSTAKPFYMALKTNLLADAAITPNIGAEFYLGRGFAVSASWHYAWWKSDSAKWYWRTYGGELALRKYLGKAAKAKPLTGHHLGIYGQAFTYDFDFGGRGYLCDSWTYAVGVEYGYSLPIHRRLNLDFSIGIGYMNGIYEEYLPQSNCYVWQSTHRLQWFGPTKLEISLVWLIGRGNYNKMGGKRR